MNIDECKLDAQLSEQNEVMRNQEDLEILRLIKSATTFTIEKINNGSDVIYAIEGLIGYIQSIAMFVNDEKDTVQEFLTAVLDIHKNNYTKYELIDDLDAYVCDYIETAIKMKEGNTK